MKPHNLAAQLVNETYMLDDGYYPNVRWTTDSNSRTTRPISFGSPLNDSITGRLNVSTKGVAIWVTNGVICRDARVLAFQKSLAYYFAVNLRPTLWNQMDRDNLRLHRIENGQFFKLGIIFDSDATEPEMTSILTLGLTDVELTYRKWFSEFREYWELFDPNAVIFG